MARGRHVGGRCVRKKNANPFFESISTLCCASHLLTLHKVAVQAPTCTAQGVELLWVRCRVTLLKVLSCSARGVESLWARCRVALSANH